MVDFNLRQNSCVVSRGVLKFVNVLIENLLHGCIKAKFFIDL